MHSGKFIFSQIMDHLPYHLFNTCVKKYKGNYKIQSFTCRDQFLCMAFAQLTYREGLRDIKVCLNSQQNKLYHMGIHGNVSRSTLAYANETRDFRMYADFAHILINIARQLYINEDFDIELSETVYALDSSTIDLCLSVFPWAPFRKKKAAIKLHTLLDLRGSIPTFISITNGKIHDVNILDELILEAGSIYVMDRGYLDFTRLYQFTRASAFFVTRAKSNTQLKRLYSSTVDKEEGIECDQTVTLAHYYASQSYPDKLRRIKYYDKETNKNLCFLTNNFTFPALTIAKLYKSRWQVELFFKWIKQHLRIKKFYGTSENAVKTQIWIAVSVYVLIAIVKKRLKLQYSLYTILQILSVTIFEKMHIYQVLQNNDYKTQKTNDPIQLNLFDL